MAINLTAVIITAIICTSICFMAWIGNNKKK